MINSKITIEPRVIQHLGQDLITSPEVAVTELLKNSIDARIEGRACEINIHLFNSVQSAMRSTQYNSVLANDLLDGIAENLKKLALSIYDGFIIILGLFHSPVYKTGRKRIYKCWNGVKG